jgi:hypothetical protein
MWISLLVQENYKGLSRLESRKENLAKDQPTVGEAKIKKVDKSLYKMQNLV